MTPEVVTHNISLFDLPIAEQESGRWSQVLQILSIAPAVSFPGSRSAALQHHQVLQIASDKSLPIRFVGYAPLFAKGRVYRGVGTDWIMMNLTHDPLYRSNKRRLVAPREVCASLRDIHQAGIDFDAIYIAHEVPVGSLNAGQRVPLDLIMPPTSLEQRNRLEWFETKTQDVFKFATLSLITLAESSVKLGAAVAVGAVVAPIAAVAAVGSLMRFDPVLFGVKIIKSVKPDHGHERQWVGGWYRLAYWHW